METKHHKNTVEKLIGLICLGILLLIQTMRTLHNLVELSKESMDTVATIDLYDMHQDAITYNVVIMTTYLFIFLLTCNYILRLWKRLT